MLSQVISQGQNGLQAQYAAAAAMPVMAPNWQALARFQNASDARAAATSSANCQLSAPGYAASQCASGLKLTVPVIRTELLR